MIRIGVLGTGMVGQALAGRLVELGHDVRIGARRTDNAAAHDWATATGERASAGDFTDAARFGEVVVNATAGANSLAALEQAGAAALAGKVLLDVTNPLAHDNGQTTLTVSNSDSLGEQIQRAFPDARVVKALNTMNCQIMVRPDLVPGEHVVFVCGESPEAKAVVGTLLAEFGWPPQRIVDLGGITASRGTEAYMLLWLAAWRALDGAHFNLALPRTAGPR
jgi:8-hydroxy-5-deazaflavin:NADPH oxidoreductase